MANFRLLGNALIDFSQVVSVEAYEDGPDFTGFQVTYGDGKENFFHYADNPKDTLAQFYANALKQDEGLSLAQSELVEHCN